MKAPLLKGHRKDEKGKSSANTLALWQNFYAVMSMMLILMVILNADWQIPVLEGGVPVIVERVRLGEDS